MIPIVIIALVWSLAKKADQPVQEMSGVIEAVTLGPVSTDHPTPERTAIIRLADGTILQAQIVTPAVVQAGQTAIIMVYERAFSATRTYEVVGTESAR